MSQQGPDAAIFIDLRVMMMVVMAMMVVVSSGEHRTRKRQQQNDSKNLLHGKNPSTIRFPADHCSDTNVPKEKRLGIAASAGWAFTRLRPFEDTVAVTTRDGGGVHWGYNDEA